MSDPKTARQGVFAGVAAMVLAVAGTCSTTRSSATPGSWWRSCSARSRAYPLSRVPLTAVPQRTALSHAFGGLAAGLVGTAKYYLWLGDGELTPFRTAAIVAKCCSAS